MFNIKELFVVYLCSVWKCSVICGWNLKTLSAFCSQCIQQ